MVDPTAVVIGARNVVCVAVVKDGHGARRSTFQCPKDRDGLWYNS